MKMLFRGHMLSNLCRTVEVCDFYDWLKQLKACSFLESLAELVAAAFLDEMFLNGLLLIISLDRWIALKDFDSYFDFLDFQGGHLILSLPLETRPIYPFHLDEPMHS